MAENIATQEWVKKYLGAGSKLGIIDIFAGHLQNSGTAPTYSKSVTIPYVEGATIAYIETSTSTTSGSYYKETTGRGVVKYSEKSATPGETESMFNQYGYSVNEDKSITISPLSDTSGVSTNYVVTFFG